MGMGILWNKIVVILHMDHIPYPDKIVSDSCVAQSNQTYQKIKTMVSLTTMGELMRVAKSRSQRQFIMKMCIATYIERPLIPEIRFEIDRCTDANAILDFRFDVIGIKKMALMLGLPVVVITHQRNRVIREEALCIVLNRLAYPKRYHDMMKTFGRSRESICDYCTLFGRKQCTSTYHYFSEIWLVIVQLWQQRVHH
jgi:hypothetical protein